MKQLMFFSMLTVFLVGCNVTDNQLTKEDTEAAGELNAWDETAVTPNHIAIFEVEGMMCEKGCGSTIRKGLYETGGVSKVEILNFSEEEHVNKIQVYFDIQKVSTEQIIEVIGKLADNRYSAKLRKITESTIS